MAGHPLPFRADATPVVRADATTAREIVFNLLSNAARYSGQDAPVDVTVDVTGNSARVVVRDHGSGVTPGDTDRIFERFIQGDGANPGGGIGLFIARGLARAHGGDLAVRPAADRASEFVLTLPLPGARPE